mmetsp:Transcript_25236/g.38850  ORF Transcript_25236/g.38850 Transcript_25236/m.38850 type:complete len:529 (+) Transcript_25236:64-1650(+)
MVKVPQNIALCVVLSAIGGILEVIATAILAYPDAQAKEGNKWTDRTLRLCLVGNLFFQILASIIGNLFAPWFGPVSIVGPIFLSAQLVANMVIYGYLLGLECFTKDMKIGTGVIVTAAILLPIVGPTVQEDQEVQKLMQTWYSIIFNILLVAGMCFAGFLLLLKYFNKVGLSRQSAILGVLLLARSTSFTINLSYSKVFTLSPPIAGMIIAAILKVLSGAIMTGSIVMQSTSVEQNTFVPLNATCIILVNAITGIIVWEDWRVVASWLGYVTVFVQLVIGNYLLLGEIDLFGPQNKRYGRALTIKRMMGNRKLANSDTDSMGDAEDSMLKDEKVEKDDSTADNTPIPAPTSTSPAATAAMEWVRSGSSSSDLPPAQPPSPQGIRFAVDIENDWRKEEQNSSCTDVDSALRVPSFSSNTSANENRLNINLNHHRSVSTGHLPSPTADGFPQRPSPLKRGSPRTQSMTTSISTSLAQRFSIKRSESSKSAWGQVLGVNKNFLEHREHDRGFDGVSELGLINEELEGGGVL